MIRCHRLFGNPCGQTGKGLSILYIARYIVQTAIRRGSGKVACLGLLNSRKSLLISVIKGECAVAFQSPAINRGLCAEAASRRRIGKESIRSSGVKERCVQQKIYLSNSTHSKTRSSSVREGRYSGSSPASPCSAYLLRIYRHQSRWPGRR